MNQKNLLSNYKVIVTGGPTREWIDPVRFLSNPSSGKMGKAIADELSKYCEECIFIHGPIESSIISGVKYKTQEIETTVDLLEAIKRNMSNNTILVMAAAPADYTPVQKSEQKIKKKSSNLVIEFKKNPDILKSISEYSDRNVILNFIKVGFAAETENFIENAQVKLKEKKLDMICLNDVSNSSIGFQSNNNQVTIIRDNGTIVNLPLMEKEKVAKEIVKQIRAICEEKYK